MTERQPVHRLDLCSESAGSPHRSDHLHGSRRRGGASAERGGAEVRGKPELRRELRLGGGEARGGKEEEAPGE